MEPVTNSTVKLDTILTPSNDRFVLFPIKYSQIYEMYRTAQSAYWTVEECDFSKDVTDWEELTKNERHFIKHILAFFSASDGIVNENLLGRFHDEVQIPEARAFYTFQAAMETVHNQTYSLMIDTFIKDSTEKQHLFNAMDTIPAVTKKTDWAKRWLTNKKDSFATRLIAFAIIEGIFFSGAFCAIYWLKSRNLMPGLTFSNELISRDESLHTEFAILLYSHLENKIPQGEIHKIFKEAVAIETEFIVDAVPCSLLGMNSELMTQYIQFVADRLLVQLGVDKLYNVKNPFAFMESISLTSNGNFFETRISSYSKASTVMADKTGNMDFSIEADF
jgi:ribonucleotide reductase beta subunit family protein with ferritin-like domain